MTGREEWWTGPGNYNGDTCANCGRERVCLVEAPDGNDRAVCDKCGWDQEANCYAVELTFPESTSTAGGEDA